MAETSQGAETPVLIKEVISREVSVFIDGTSFPEIKDIQSREISLFIESGSLEPLSQLISREVSFVGTTPEPPPGITNFSVAVSPTGKQVTLDWSQANQWSVLDIGYIDIYLSPVAFTSVAGMNPVLRLPAESVTATLNNLPEWQDHFMAVVPVDAAGHFGTNVIYSAAYVLSPQVVSRELSVFIDHEVTSRLKDLESRELSIVVVDPTPPAAIGAVTKTVNPTGSVVTLDWKGYDEWAQKGVIRYDIYYSDHPFESLVNLHPLASVPAETQFKRLENLPTWRDHSFAIVPVKELNIYSKSAVSFGVYVLMPIIVSRETSVSIDGINDPLRAQHISREVTLLVTDTNTPAPITGLGTGFHGEGSQETYRGVDVTWPNYDEPAQRDVVRYRVYVDTQFFEDVTGMIPFAYLPPDISKSTIQGLFSDNVYFVAVVAEDATGRFDPHVRSTIVQAANRSIWRRAYFTRTELGNPNLEPTLWGDEADPDGDHYVNLFEYALGGDLRTASDRNERSNGPLAPEGYLVTEGDARRFEFRFRSRINPDSLGLRYDVQLTRDFIHWFPPNAHAEPWTLAEHVRTQAEEGMDAFELNTWRFPISLLEPSRVFSRLEISISEASNTSSSDAIEHSTPARYWRFDDLPHATTTVDSISGVPATLGPGVQLGRKPHPKRGYCAEFDGNSDSWMGLATGWTSGPLGIEFWIRPGAIPNGIAQSIISNPSETVELRRSANGVAEFAFKEGTDPARTVPLPVKLDLATTYHVYLALDGSSFKVWINGNQISSLRLSDYRPLANFFKGTIAFGKALEPSLGSVGFNGLLDEVAIYNGVLNEADIGLHYQAGKWE